MNAAFSQVQLTEALARANQHWQVQHGEKPAVDGSIPKAFTIAFSRETGTYGAAIAREVANRLGWPVYDRELLQRIADDLGVRNTLLESVDERSRGWLSECLAGLFSVPEVTDTAYFRRLVETLVSLASHGNCVIVGRGATAALPLATTLRVRVVAPLEHRIKSVQEEHSISIADATRRVETTDWERNRFTTGHFHVDPTESSNYDLVLNAARFSASECADLVLAAFDRLRAQSRSNLSSKVVQTSAAT